MRKIESSVDVEKRRANKARWISIAILLMLALSSLGYSFLSRTEDTSSSNQNVQTDGSQWYVNVNGRQHVFLTSPETAKGVEVNTINRINNYLGKEVYISSDNDGITYEIGSNLEGYASRVQRACFGECEQDYPEKDCNSTLIVWKSAEINKVYQKDNCIFIDGDMRAADAFLYKLLGIN